MPRLDDRAFWHCDVGYAGGVRYSGSEWPEFRRTHFSGFLRHGNLGGRRDRNLSAMVAFV
jgi:hypothetical protein